MDCIWRERVYDIAITDRQQRWCNQQNLLDRISSESPSISFQQILIYSSTMQTPPSLHTSLTESQLIVSLI